MLVHMRLSKGRVVDLEFVDEFGLSEVSNMFDSDRFEIDRVDIQILQSRVLSAHQIILLLENQFISSEARLSKHVLSDTCDSSVDLVSSLTVTVW